MKEYLLFQAYTNEGVILECKYALLRIIDVCKKAQRSLPNVIIYTDMPTIFQHYASQLPLTLRVIDDDDIKRWRGQINFVHRVKIEVFKDCIARFPGKIIYCDTDTYLLQPLDEVFNAINASQVFFHENEGSLNTPTSKLAKKWKKFLLKHSASFDGLSPTNADMWNAGVIGLTTDHLPLLNEVLELTDHLYTLFPKHAVEQFSFGYIFQKHKISILSAKPYIFHYWNLKEFRMLLKLLFDKGFDLDQQVKKSAMVSPENIVSAKLKFKQSSLVKKMVLAASGKNWSINKYKI